MIIGTVGTLGAGKTTLVEYLESKGFVTYRFSDVIRGYLKDKSPSREQFQDKGDELRAKYGTDFLAREIWTKIAGSQNKKIVVDGLRNAGEVKFFRQKGNFYLISVDKDRRARFKRTKIRSSSLDPLTYQQFMTMEKRDLDEGSQFGQQTQAVMKLADFSLTNDNPLEFNLEIEKILAQIDK